MSHANYDAIIIGAGMSGLACGIRLAMFDKKVCILEKHIIAGGLNSYYQRRNTQHKGIRQFDVGLHALTNFIPKGTKNRPFSKLLKQLRLDYDAFKLCPQSYSVIDFASEKLRFSNDFSLLHSEIAEKFPKQIDGFNKLLSFIENFNELDLSQGQTLARPFIEKYISEPLLVEMILAPLLIYGSAWENDMDLAQFVIMFKSIYQEGFSRPEGGVRTIINLLMEKYKSLGGEILFNHGVTEIIQENNQVIGVKTSKDREFRASKIFSCAGLPETLGLFPEANKFVPAVGKLSFVETILVTEKKIPITQFDGTIIFYNNSDKYHYQKSESLFDPRSAVICCPDNYEISQNDGEGTLRATFIANYDLWKKLSEAEYKFEKEKVFHTAKTLMEKLLGPLGNIHFQDVFTPLTVEKYTSHYQGTVYGSTDKTRNGTTPYKGLYIIGTDQGFLGIVGSMLSGISIGNLYGLMEVKA